MSTKTALLLLTSALGLLCAQAPLPDPTKLGRITIAVLDSVTSQPIPNAEVMLQAHFGPPLSGTTSTDGRIEFTRIQPGDYQVASVKAAHYFFDPVVRTSIPLTGQQLANTATIRLAPQGRIRGTVLNDRGEPVASAAVSALRAMGSPTGTQWLAAMSVMADAQGNYELPDLTPDRYIVRAMSLANAKEQLERTFYPSSEATETALRLDVAAGAILERVDFRLLPATLFHIRGTIAGDQLPPKSTVLAQDCSASRTRAEGLWFTQLDADGRFDVGGVPHGTVCVSYGATKDFKPFGTTTVSVVDRDIDGVALTVTPPRDIEGQFRIPSDAPPAVPQVMLVPSGPFPAPPVEARVDTVEGTFHLAGVLPMEYHIVISPPGGTYVKSITQAGQDHSNGTLIPADGALVIELGTATSRLTGRINWSGAPARELTVTASPQGDLRTRSDLRKIGASTIAGDYFVFGLAPGTYKVIAWDTASAFSAGPDLVDQLPGAIVTIGEGEQRALELRPLTARELELAKQKF